MHTQRKTANPTGNASKAIHDVIHSEDGFSFIERFGLKRLAETDEVEVFYGETISTSITLIKLPESGDFLRIIAQL